MSPQSSHRSAKRLDLHIVDLYQLDLARIVRKFFVYAFAGVLREKICTLQISLSFANFSHFQLGELRKKLAGELNFFL